MTATLSLPVMPDPWFDQDKQDWTVDDLATLPKDLRYELIDGRLILPSPTALHQELGSELRTMLRPNCPPGYRPVTDLSLEIDDRNEPRPDVAVIRMALGMRSPLPIEGALLVVEVISPTSHFRDMYAKTKVYAAAGVGSYWVIDPTFEAGVTLTEFRPVESGEFEMVGNTKEKFTTGVPYPVTIDLPALTEMRNEFRAAAQQEQ